MPLTLWERNCQLEQTAFPDRLLLARNDTFPVPQVQLTLHCARWLGIETERVVAPPLLSTSIARS